MSFAYLINRAGKFVADNSPTILTTIGVTGSLTTAYLTGKASFKAALILAEETYNEELADNEEEFTGLTFQRKLELTWRLYIPAASSAALTVFSIVSANRIGSRRTAALAAVYSLSEKALDEYKTKVVEKIGASKERKIRDEIAQDQVDKNPLSSREVIITGGGEVLCFDAYTGRYFYSDMEKLRKAQNDLNHQVLNSYYASLTDFYELIGLPRTSESDEVGWNSDEMLEIMYSTTLSEDGRPCISITFKVTPVRNFHRLQ